MQPETSTPSAFPLETDKRKFLIVALNGTALYVLAYYLVWGLYQIAKLGTSRFYGLRSTWDPSRIVFTSADGEWWPTAVISVYTVGPLVGLLAGLAAFRWYWKHARARRGQFKLLLLWVAFHGCNAVFGALLSDMLTQTGAWYVFDWLLRPGKWISVLIAVVAGLVQLALGYLGAVAFLQAHDSKTVMSYANRPLMIASTLLVPWVGGGVFIALVKLPYLATHETLHLLTVGLLVVPLAVSCLKEAFSDTVKRPQPTHVVWGLVVLAVVVALFWRWALSPALVFG